MERDLNPYQIHKLVVGHRYIKTCYGGISFQRRNSIPEKALDFRIKMILRDNPK